MKTVGTLLFTLSALGGLSGFPAPRCEARVYDSDGSEASVQACIRSAADGDIVTLPAGTFSWTSRLNITKGITLQGATTITGPVSNPTITDATIIQDDTPRSGSSVGIIRVEVSSSQSFRLTGITFAPGSSTTYDTGNGAIHLLSHGSAPNTSMRIDHCHFDHLYQGKLIWVSGWTYGVADHNVLDCRRSYSFYFWAESYGGTSRNNGNGAWADYTWYGTDKFFFVEDNRINGGGNNNLSGGTDSDHGARYVIRHNYWHNAGLNTHGTEGGSMRGVRAYEVYDNVFDWTTVKPASAGQRSGGSFWHDNTWTGLSIGTGVHTALTQFRQIGGTTARSTFGPAAVSPWDMNDTEGNGTFVEGHAPYLYETGTDTSSVNSQGVIHDSTKNWVPNHWVGYFIRNMNPNAGCFQKSAYVKSNTSNTITYIYYPETDRGPTIVFNTGDDYDIHRVLATLDQSGRGKGDQVTGGATPINTVTGTPFWTHEIQEPCFSWNNVHNPGGTVYRFNGNSNACTILEGRDYYNLGAGLPADSTPAQVSSTYRAALNGTDYTGTFVYPHPLVTAAPSATPRSQQHLEKKEAKKAKKLKRRKGDQKKSGK